MRVSLVAACIASIRVIYIYKYTVLQPMNSLDLARRANEEIGINEGIKNKHCSFATITLHENIRY